MSNTSFTPAEAAAISSAGGLVTCLVALIPAWSASGQIIVAAVGGALSLAFMLANAIHAHGAARVQAAMITPPAAGPPTPPAPSLERPVS